MPELIIKTLEVGMLGTSCYLVMDGSPGPGFIIDPGAEARVIVEVAGSSGMACRGILCTHGHMDHVGAVGKVAQALEAPVYVSEPDSGALTGHGQGITGRLTSLAVSKPGGVNIIRGGDTLEFGKRSLSVLETPGHTPGSVSFLCDDNLFCGDLVFAGSVGRTDLRGGSFADLLDSVIRHVFTLPDDAVIYPGHGPSTTVGRERASNPFLRELGARGR
ncbi:MAG: MBL fold metallo-hydrolase [Actinobacteria bacterium]|nr:MBL fold metallo-hydrolase [Actinomycetota bacterium]MBU1942281.1 MBL fold metallo-hydrolase [Actinomycetota bacterium]MBU2687370.1 MBL fold metallo-hydrolase [Actinomycetota bacterium]